MTLPTEQLEALAGEGGLLTGKDVHARAAGIWDPSPLEADLLLRPRTTDEVAAILALCHAQGQPVVPHGGLTGLVKGAQTRSGGCGRSKW